MGGGESTFIKLMGFLESVIKTFPDKRNGKNCVYTIRDASLSAFSVFHTQFPSFLSYQQIMQDNKGNNNAKTVYGVHEIPTDNCIRMLLDPIAPEFCYPIFNKVHSMLADHNIFKDEFYTELGTYTIALDGTWFHSSENIYCDACLTKEHRDGRITHYHSAVTPVFVKAGNNHVIATEPEFITSQDGKIKQDCEINAAKRWISNVGYKYVHMGVTLLGDDLYAKHPFCCDVATKGFHFIFTCKSSSHKYLYEWIDAAEQGVDITEIVKTSWTGKKKLYKHYRYMNNVPIRDGEDALPVNWCELIIKDEQGKITKRFAFITDHHITDENVIIIVEAGRSRWKIENEHNNTLKTKGYNLEHNFGHGKVYLSNLLLTMNLLAFLFHTVLQIFDKRYAVLRKVLGRRMAFFNDIRALTRYWCFESWDDLLMFMLRGLKIPDPGG